MLTLCQYKQRREVLCRGSNSTAIGVWENYYLQLYVITYFF